MSNSPYNPYRSFIVEASAGTGKTYQASRRYLALVAANAPLADILAITFTVKAAKEIRERVFSFATEMYNSPQKQKDFDEEIAGFYAKANNIAPPKSAKEVATDILTKSQRLKIATIDSVLHEWLVSLAGQGFPVQYPFTIMEAEEEEELKQQIWKTLWLEIDTIPHAEELIAEHGIYSVKRKTKEILDVYFKKFEQHKFLETEEKDTGNVDFLNRQGNFYTSLAQRFQYHFNKAKKNMGKMVFADLLAELHRLLAEDEGVLFFLSQRIVHVLLDEFQDINNQQWEIFHRISEELLSGNNLIQSKYGIQSTIFIVGDTKQSIYGFRGANPQIMHDAISDLRIFSPTVTYLQTNYRTSKHLLSFYNLVFPKLGLHDFRQHQPVQGEQQIKGRSEVHLVSLSTTDADGEAQYVAEHIKQLLDNADDFPIYEQNNKRSLSAGDICILYRNTTHAEKYIDELAQKNIKYHKHEGHGFFNRQEVLDMMALCKWLVTTEDQQALMTVLCSPIGGIDTLELLSIYNEIGDKKMRTELVLNALEKKHKELVVALRDVVANRSRTVHELFFFAMYRLCVFSSYRETSLQSNIMNFLNIVTKISSGSICGLAEVYHKLWQKQQVDNQTVTNVEHNAVNLMTVHKAKGLEFPYAILVEANNAWSRRDIYWLKKNESIKYIGTKNEQPKSFSDMLADEKQQRKAEELRVLYVALTRAKNYLMVCGRKQKRKGESSLYLDNLIKIMRDTSGYIYTEDDEKTTCVSLLHNTE